MNKFTKIWQESKAASDYAFIKGWSELRQRDVDIALSELKEVLGIKSDSTFCRRLTGQIQPTVEEYNSIVRVFSKYGVEQPFGV